MLACLRSTSNSHGKLQNGGVALCYSIGEGLNVIAIKQPSYMHTLGADCLFFSSGILQR